MQITLDIPDELARPLVPVGEDVARVASKPWLLKRTVIAA